MLGLMSAKDVRVWLCPNELLISHLHKEKSSLRYMTRDVTQLFSEKGKCTSLTSCLTTLAKGKL